MGGFGTAWVIPRLLDTSSLVVQVRKLHLLEA